MEIRYGKCPGGHSATISGKTMVWELDMGIAPKDTLEPIRGMRIRYGHCPNGHTGAALAGHEYIFCDEGPPAVYTKQNL